MLRHTGLRCFDEEVFCDDVLLLNWYSARKRKIFQEGFVHRAMWGRVLLFFCKAWKAVACSCFQDTKAMWRNPCENYLIHSFDRFGVLGDPKMNLSCVFFEWHSHCPACLKTGIPTNPFRNLFSEEAPYVQVRWSTWSNPHMQCRRRPKLWLGNRERNYDFWIHSLKW